MRVAVVIRDFADYAVGFAIREAKEIEAILAGHNAAHVVVAEHPAEEKPVKATS